MDTKALQFECRFSLPPNSLGYCGKDSAPEKFKKCIISGECEGVEEELIHFIVLHPYVKTLAQITGLPAFSYDVFESYWIGNDLLKKAKLSDYDLLLDNFLTQGVPENFVKELREKKPKKFIPHHLFQILHVGVGKASGAVPFNIESINSCMIRWGKVQQINGNDLTVNLNSLKEERGAYKITQEKGSYTFLPEFLPGLKAGDTVAVHWKQVIKILTDDETEKLSFWTREVIKSLA